MSDPAAPEIPADIAAAFAGGPAVIDAAAAAGITPPPGLVALFQPAAAPVPQPAPVPAEPEPAATHPAEDSAPAPAAAAAAPAALAAPPIRYLSAKPRSLDVKLDWPVSWNGNDYYSIKCERMSGRELDEFFDLPAEQRTFLPTIKAPAELIAELDADDQVKVREVGLSFLPRSLGLGSQSNPEVSDLSPGTSAGT